MALCEDFLYPVDKNPSKNMEGTDRNLLTHFTKLQLALSCFSRKARLFDTILLQNSFTEYHENRTN